MNEKMFEENMDCENKINIELTVHKIQKELQTVCSMTFSPKVEKVERVRRRSINKCSAVPARNGGGINGGIIICIGGGGSQSCCPGGGNGGGNSDGGIPDHGPREPSFTCP